MFKIDLDNTYEPKYVSDGLDHFIVESETIDGAFIDLHVNISAINNDYLSNVFNLGFGPLNANGEIDDQAKIKHKYVDKVISTMILLGITYLNDDKEKYIGIDGSNDIRAYMYHRMFRYNLEDLSELLSVAGVDWYVKLLRNQTDIERDEKNDPLFKPRPEQFDIERDAKDMYRYYMFKLI